jgi:hypothetical protein
VREDRSALKLKFAAAALRFHDDVCAENVGGHQIGSELDAVEGKIEHFAQGTHQQCLAQSGHALQQDMPACEQCNHCTLDDLFLTYDYFTNFGAKRRVRITK